MPHKGVDLLVEAGGNSLLKHAETLRKLAAWSLRSGEIAWFNLVGTSKQTPLALFGCHEIILIVSNLFESIPTMYKRLDEQ